MTSSFFILNQKKSARSPLKVKVLFYAQQNQPIRAITAKPCQKSEELSVTAKYILVPTDFSDAADYALDYAIELAKTLQARLTVLHVFHLSSLALGEAPPAVLDDTLKAMEANVQQQIQMDLARVQQAGLQGDSVIVEGVPFQAIIDTARDSGADLIVMGTHGRTGLTHVLMGSVADKVVRLAPCPVLVTRAATEDATT
jgi:nucleotide-binding universal stress UspA family protein